MLGEQTVSVGRIEFFSSLSSEEMQTARYIRESVRDEISKADVPLGTELSLVESSSEFFGAIERFVNQALEDGKGVILQIDAHGAADRSGIVLNNGELVTWATLKLELAKLNGATKFALIVVLSLCYGAHLISASTPLEESPFWGMIGPRREIDAGLLVDGLVSFYRRWIETDSGDEAVEALNQAAGEKGTFYFTTAERFFTSIYLDFLRNYAINDKNIADEARKLHRKLKKEGVADRPSVGSIKRLLKASDEGFFESCKSTYFMIDQFPEVANRIHVELADVKQLL